MRKNNWNLISINKDNFSLKTFIFGAFLLSIAFACNSDKKLQTNFLINGNDLKDASSFTSTPDPSKNEAIVVKVGETVNFQDFSLPSSQSKSWAWDMDDNGIPEYTTKDCSHVYDLIGSYLVKLCVNDENTCISKWIVVEDASPTSNNSVVINSTPTVENEHIIKEKKMVEVAQQQENEAKAEAKRLADEAKAAADNQKKLEQTRQAEAKRIEKEQKMAEQKARFAAQQEAQAKDAAEKARLKEEKRLAQAELERKKQEAADAQRIAEKQKAEEARKVAEAQKLAAQKEEEARKKEAEKRAAEEKLAAQQAAAKKEAERRATEERKAADERRVAEERRAAEEKLLTQQSAEKKAFEDKNKFLANNNEAPKTENNAAATPAPLRRVGQAGMTIGNADCVKNNTNYVKESYIILTPKEKIKLSKASVYCNAHGTVTVMLSGKGVNKQITSNVNIGKSQLSLLELRTELLPGNHYTLKVVANSGVEIADLSECLTEKNSDLLDTETSNSIFQLVFNY